MLTIAPNLLPVQKAYLDPAQKSIVFRLASTTGYPSGPREPLMKSVG